MGLYVQSLENIPANARRGYYIYLLDYGWAEPLGDALLKNYEQMAAIAAESNAVVIRGTHRVHFEDQVLSWHNINGENAAELLPAILITNRNPHRFKESYHADSSIAIESHLKLVLIPLKKFCRTTSEVVTLIQKLFSDIKAGKPLEQLQIVKEVKRGNGKALADAIILGPARQRSKSFGKTDIEAYFHSKASQTNVQMIERTVHRIHFEDQSGAEFERLVYAYLARQKKWDRIEWLGQAGSDGGRDIWGIFEGKSYCYQCANYQKLTLKKVTDDIDKLVNGQTVPDCFTVVCGGTVSAVNRQKVKAYAAKNGLEDTAVWSGVEFEEQLRFHAPDLVKRFIEGEAFPEGVSGQGISNGVDNAATDQKIMADLSECFDRPAFTTPFMRESSIPDFERAISDTIAVLNTGVHRLRDGTVIRNIASRHKISSPALRQAWADITTLVVKLRDTVTKLKREGAVQHCGCGDDECPTYMISNSAATIMDKLRKEIFERLNATRTETSLRLYR